MGVSPGEVDEFGTLERVGGTSVLRYRRRLAHPRELVWRALTEDAHLAEWFPTTIEGARAAGAPLHLTFREPEGEPFDGEMLAFEPPPSLPSMIWRWRSRAFRREAQRRR